MPKIVCDSTFGRTQVLEVTDEEILVLRTMEPEEKYKELRKKILFILDQLTTKNLELIYHTVYDDTDEQTVLIEE